jgi:hypothetical protein
MHGDLDGVDEQDMRLKPPRGTMRASCRRYLCLSATLSTAQQAPSDDAELEVVAEGARRPCEAVMLPIGQLVDREIKRSVDEQRVKARSK